LKLNQAHDRAFQELVADPVLSQFAEKDPEVKKQLAGVLDAAKKATSDTAWMNNPDAVARAVRDAMAYPVAVKLYQNKLAQVLGELKKERAKVLNLRGPSGLSTQARQAAYQQTNKAPVPQGVEAIVKGAFAGKI
jgi:hypothetical protein